VKLDDLHTQDMVNRVRGGIMATGLLPTCCIASTAIWVSVLRNFGFKAHPVSVKLEILNKPFAEFVEKHGRVPDDTNEAEMDAVTKSGARIVSLGRPKVAGAPYGAMDPKTNAWSGHLVVVARPKGGEGTGYITDLSLPQANRPHKGITIVNPLVIPAPVAELKKFMAGGRAQGKVGDALLIYESVPGDATYHASPDWHDQKVRWSVLVEELTRAIESFLKGARSVEDFKAHEAKG